MIKASIGKLNIIFDSKDLALQSGFELLEFTSQAALLLTATPDQLPLSCGQYIEFAMHIRSPEFIHDIIPPHYFNIDTEEIYWVCNKQLSALEKNIKKTKHQTQTECSTQLFPIVNKRPRKL